MEKLFDYNMNIQSLKKVVTIVLVSGFSLSGLAQKLPSEQKEPMPAPLGLKIDGKAADWGDAFKAHNNAIGLFYTIANDAENLYLVMQTDQQSATDKIFYGGISLVIKSKTDKKAEPLKLTYPLVSLTERSGIIIPLRDKKNNIDSVMTLVNGNIEKFAKKITISGFPDLTGPDISVFNDVGIKAAARAGTNRAITFEIQLPLKYIRHLLDNNSSFDYSIVVNGDTVPANTTIVVGASLNGSSGGGAVNDASVNAIFSPTDLKASYKLVK
jgi:hypothetical protein